MTDLNRMARSYYDNKESVAACQAFFEDPDNPEKLNAAWESVLPIIGIIVKQNFKHLQPDDIDDLIQSAAIEYWRFLALSETKPRPFDIRAHFNLYYKVGWRAMVKAKEVNASNVIEFFANGAMPFTSVSNFKLADQKMFIKQLPIMVYEKVVAMIENRFSNEEFLVCEYIARCLVFEEPIRRFQIRQIGGRITNAEFFENYVDTLVRAAYVEVRETTDIADLLGDEGAALDPIYYHDHASNHYDGT